ncbi:uncharacterized protein LOC142337024 isoform X2 [Convolutriloba macropyga]|uniref:uncharacterized protein LOC142337024 isoform X2 n=1 Tax=Convolutriloba macropyga TaxID=536237 RepID=UPI003F51F654
MSDHASNTDSGKKRPLLGRQKTKSASIRDDRGSNWGAQRSTTTSSSGGRNQPSHGNEYVQHSNYDSEKLSLPSVRSKDRVVASQELDETIGSGKKLSPNHLEDNENDQGAQAAERSVIFPGDKRAPSATTDVATERSSKVDGSHEERDKHSIHTRQTDPSVAGMETLKSVYSFVSQPLEKASALSSDPPKQELSKPPRLPKLGKKGNESSGKKGKTGKKKKEKSEPRQPRPKMGMVDKATFYQAPDDELMKSIQELEWESTIFNKKMMTQTDDIKKMISLQEETVGRVKHKLLSVQNKEIVIENLKNQIYKSQEEGERDFAERQKKQKTLALENKMSAAMYFESHVAAEKEAMRAKCLYRCPHCKEIVIERAQNYAKLLTRLWEDNACARMLSGSWKAMIDEMVTSREAALQQVIDKLWEMHLDFEKAAAHLLKNFGSKIKENELEAIDYHNALLKLHDTHELFETVKSEFEEAKRNEEELLVKYRVNKTQEKELRRSLKHELEFVKTRERHIREKKNAKWLREQIEEEKVMRSKLEARKKHLEYNLNYVKESFKYSEEVRKKQLSDNRNVVLPQIQKQTKRLLYKNEFRSSIVEEQKQIMDRRSNILEDVKEKGWQLSRELKLSTVEASIMVKQRQDNDVALNQLESDLRSTSHFLKQVMAEPRKNRKYINDMQQVNQAAKKWLSKIEKNCRHMRYVVGELKKQGGRMQGARVATGKQVSFISSDLKVMSKFNDANQFYMKLQRLVQAFEDSGVLVSEIDKIRDKCDSAESSNSSLQASVLETLMKMKRIKRQEVDNARDQSRMSEALDYHKQSCDSMI